MGAGALPFPGFQYHPLAASYFLSVTSLSLSQKYRINNCIVALADAGIASVLVDACFLRAGQNTETNSPKTLKGVTGALDGSPGWTADGIALDGVTTRGLWTVPTVSAHSLVIDPTGVPTGQISDGTLGGLSNSAGINTSASLIELNTTLHGFVYTRQGGSVAVTGQIGTTDSAFCVHYYNPMPQCIVMTNDNAASPTIKVYVDGFLALTDSAGNVQSTSALNSLFVGARLIAGPAWDTPWKGCFGAWLLFSRVLTPTEVLAATAAVRNLDQKPVNLVTYGDSRTAQLSDATRVVGNWPAQLMRTPQWYGRARLCNAALNGAAASALAAAYSTRVAQYAPDGIAVREAYFMEDSGTNDILAGDSAATILANRKLIWAAARNDGFPVMACSVYGARSGGFTAPQEAVRVALNAAVLACLGVEIHAFFDNDALLTKFAESSLFVDNIHAANSGNAIYANAIARGVTDFPIGGNVTVQATSATTGTMTVQMIGAVQTITPTGDCTFNAVGGAPAQECAFVITTTGAVSRTLTWGTNFKTTGTLATGGTGGKIFVVNFRSPDGLNWYETSRTTAM